MHSRINFALIGLAALVILLAPVGLVPGLARHLLLAVLTLAVFVGLPMLVLLRIGRAGDRSGRTTG